MKKMVGRILGLALCLGALLGALCLSASAEGEQHTAHYSCGEADCTNNNHGHSQVTEWTELTQTSVDADTNTLLLEDGKSYYLGSNITVKSKIKITGTVNLCLNGKTITVRVPKDTVDDCVDQIIYVESGELILSDCGDDGTLTRFTGDTYSVSGTGVRVISGGTFTMYGGTIKGNKSASEGGGVGVLKGGKFTMYGGTISGNESEHGSSAGDGGGVFVQGTFEMYGGTITGNTASGRRNGGGVGINSGRFIMHNGMITGNEEVGGHKDSLGGGGVYIEGGTFEMMGGIISGNTAADSGGGVYMKSGTFKMEDGTISNNKAAGSNSSLPGGGGVYVIGNSTFEMTNGTISGNQALNGNGGGMYFYAGTSPTPSLTISGSAKIEDNLAAGSGGVYVDGVTFKVSGNISIAGNKGGCTADTSGNLTDGSDSNVYLTYHAEAPRYITVMGALTNRIQVTTEKQPDSSSCVKIATATSANSANALAKLDYTNTADGKTIPLIAIENTNGGVDIFACIHNWSDDWSADETNHWHECLICNGKDKEIAHTYTAEEKNGAALKTAGTCTSEAVYYYSCSACGRVEKNDDHTFKGDLDSSNHAGTESWVQTATTHEKKWDCCDKVTVTSEDHAWNDGVCTMCSYTCKHPDAKDNGDCTKAVVCDVCGETVTAAESDHDWSEWSSNKNGTHTRSCKRANCEKTETKNCSGGTATCTKKAVCTTCKAEYGDLAAHDYTAETKSDSTLKTPGTCISKAVYYYSCSVCGDVEKNDNHTFEGDLDSSNHAKSLSDWHSDGNRHWKEYPCCKARTDEGACSGGTATCTEKAVCTTCNTPYGETDPNNHDWSPEWTSDENRHWHTCTRKDCGATSGEAEHTWDTGEITTQPTCTEAGEKTFICTKCSRVKTERIDAKGHSYGQDWEHDDTHHWHKCTNCDATDGNAEHSGGTATCTAKAICEVCNTSYGEINPAKHSGTLGEDWYSDDSHHWKKYRCCNADGDKSDHTWDGGVISTDPTCTASGERTYTCADCGMTKTEAVSALGHDWGEWTVTTPATADAEGVETRICGNNGSHRQTRAIPMITAATCPKDASCPLADFSDLVPTAWYHDGVHYCLENGLMQGFAGGLFLPEGSTTRGQLAAILWRLEGSPAAEGGTDFTDVGPDSWCAAAVRWASSVDVVLGFGDGRFAPDAAVTREQTAAILWRYAAYKGWDLSAGTDLAAFSDAADVSSYAVPAMQWACGSGLLIGDGAALLPQGTALRVQTAAMMQRFCTAFSALSAQA